MLRLLLLLLCFQQVVIRFTFAGTSNTLTPQGLNLQGSNISKQQKPRFKLKFVQRDEIVSNSSKKGSTIKTPSGRPVRYYLPIYEVAETAEKEVLAKNKKNISFQPSKKKATLWLFSPDLLTSESAHSNSFHRAQHHQHQGHLFKQISANNNNNNHQNNHHHHPNQINSRPARDNFNSNHQRNQQQQHPNQIDQRFPVKNGHQGPPMQPQKSHSNGNFNGHQNRQLPPNIGNQNLPPPHQNQRQNENNRPNQLQQQQSNFQTPPRHNQKFIPSNNNNQKMANFNNGNNNSRNQQNSSPPNLMNGNKNVQPKNLNIQNPNQHFRSPMNHPPNNNGNNGGNFNNVNHSPKNLPNHNQQSNNNHHPNQISNKSNFNAPSMQNGGGQNHNSNFNNNNLNQNNIIKHINNHLNNPKPEQNQQPDHQNKNNNRNKEVLNELGKPHGDKYKEEVESHNLDSEHFPHQYAIQIRWGKPGELGNLAKTEKPATSSAPPTIKRKLPREDRTMNDEKSRYRQFAHQEEEHWHDKKWINLGAAPKEVEDVSSLPENDQLYAVSQEKFKTLPVFVRPLRNDATMAAVHEHFAVPSKSFPVNRRFADWANAPVRMREHRIGVNGNNLSAESRRNFEAREIRRKRNNYGNGNRRGHWRRLRRFD